MPATHWPLAIAALSFSSLLNGVMMYFIWGLLHLSSRDSGFWQGSVIQVTVDTGVCSSKTTFCGIAQIFSGCFPV
ncbi:MAG: hypothetical protein ACFUZC_02875 [Chthoniobacteraceae bacterium]